MLEWSERHEMPVPIRIVVAAVMRQLLARAAVTLPVDTPKQEDGDLPGLDSARNYFFRV